MNYYPYINMMNIPVASARTGLLSGLFKGISFRSILNGTGKVLNIANQAIPLIKQAKPVLNNAKTMFRVMNEFKKVDTVRPNNNEITEKKIDNIVSNKVDIKTSNSLPTFFQ